MEAQSQRPKEMSKLFYLKEIWQVQEGERVTEKTIWERAEDIMQTVKEIREHEGSYQKQRLRDALEHIRVEAKTIQDDIRKTELQNIREAGRNKVDIPGYYEEGKETGKYPPISIPWDK